MNLQDKRTYSNYNTYSKLVVQGLNLTLYLLIGFFILSSNLTFGQENESQWRTATPELSSFDLQKLNRAIEKLDSLEESYSLIIVRNGLMVSENYFHGASPNELHHIRSATKTIMGILIGIAIDKQFISGPEQKLSAYFPDYKYADTISIQHLLDMRSGIDWNEHRGDLLQWQNSSNPNGFLFDKGLINQPGKSFNYNSSTTHLLSHIIYKATGTAPEAFARQFLFEPLGIKSYKWMKLQDDFINGGYGLEIKPIDLAKIGYLFLNEGSWEENKILSKAWIAHSLTMNTDFNRPFGSFFNSGYGNLWWVGQQNDTTVYFALGYGGQFLAVVPQFDLIVVVTQQWGMASNSLEREDAITEIINLILKSIVV